MMRPGFAPIAPTIVERPTPHPTSFDIELFVAGLCPGKGRLELVNAAAVRRGARPVLRASNEEEQDIWVRQIKAALVASGQVPTEPWLHGVWLWAQFVKPRPATAVRTSGCPSRRLRDWETQHVATPDSDKMLRCAYDALKTVGAYRDDAQVCDGAGPRKRYARPGETPGLHLLVAFLPPESQPVSEPV